MGKPQGSSLSLLFLGTLSSNCLFLSYIQSVDYRLCYLRLPYTYTNYHIYFSVKFNENKYQTSSPSPLLLSPTELFSKSLKVSTVFSSFVLIFQLLRFFGAVLTSDFEACFIGEGTRRAWVINRRGKTRYCK